MTSNSNAQPAGASSNTASGSVAIPKRTFYRRTLKPPNVAFSSTDGRRLFREALKEGTMECYFPLAEQFRTQDEPAFCGLSTLTMVLNALAVDPGRVWKGAWRWYHESMLDCCAPLDTVKAKGITMATLGCLARCNGLTVDMSGPDTHTIEDLRAVIEECTKTDHGKVLVVSYDRRGLNQTGTGHFSPVGGYHRAEDSVLIMDTARFKHPPHWAPLPMLWEAMKTLDPETGKPRGYMVLEKAHNLSHRLFTANSANYKDWPQIASWVKDVVELANSTQQEEERGGDGKTAEDAAVAAAHGGAGRGVKGLRDAKTIAEFVPVLLEMLPPVMKGLLITFNTPEHAAAGAAQDGVVLQAIQDTDVYREVKVAERCGRSSRSPSVGGTSNDSGDGGGTESAAPVCSGAVQAKPQAQAQAQAGSSAVASLDFTPPSSPASVQAEETGCGCSSRHVLSIMTYALLLLLHKRDDHGGAEAAGAGGDGDDGRGDGGGSSEPLWRRDPLQKLPATVADEAKHVAGMLRGLVEMEHCEKCSSPSP